MFENIKNEIEKNNAVKLKIYSLEYLIEKKDNYYMIYALLYANNISKYNSLEELFEYFTIYNENLYQTIDRIIILK